MSEKAESGYKVVLSSGREVLLREMKIRHQNLAMKAIGTKAGNNAILASSLFQEELLRILLVSVDGKQIDKIQALDLDSLFSYAEYGQLLKVIGKIMGGDEAEGELVTEIVTM